MVDKANEGFYLGGGVSVLNDARNGGFPRVAVGEIPEDSRGNADITWTRFPSTRSSSIGYKFSLGRRRELRAAPRLKGSGDESSIDTAAERARRGDKDYLLGRVGWACAAPFSTTSPAAARSEQRLGVSFGIAF